ncbi:nucleosome assembly protein [Hypoxylon rubiginosum]|uniref:Nucleosome assembly protein n=1 Tax=Hypoxylon rubiginosum TaxID=110542 RepID=A0ACB9YVY9_9PEZI|nr:nucleosome assembly protein [Hypoxylon rubiginosum]
MADEVDMADVALATYEELMDLERDFEDTETEILRQQVILTKPLYEKREKLIAKIPNFWALVFEQAPADLDQFIHPTDSAVLLSSLTSLSVSHFDIENGGKGEPRNFSIKMEFSENEWFENKVLEKKFWHRESKDGDAGLVSEPVPIKWKSADKDLTQGMLDLAVKVWENDKKQGQSDSTKVKKEKDYTPDEKALKEKVNATSRGAVSFFAWFGFRGLNISEEESRLAVEKEKKERADRAAGKVPDLQEVDDEEDEDEDEDEDPFELEIFREGDELAIEISEDLWPNAIKYFTQAQEVDISDMDFEDIDEDEEMDEDDEEEKPKTNGS